MVKRKPQPKPTNVALIRAAAREEAIADAVAHVLTNLELPLPWAITIADDLKGMRR